MQLTMHVKGGETHTPLKVQYNIEDQGLDKTSMLCMEQTTCNL